MSDDQAAAYFGVVRIFAPGTESALYDIVRHEPGYADHVMARGAYPDAVAIVDALNRRTNHRGADEC
jgi:hypothetical protein